MRKLKYVKLFEKFQVNEGLFTDLFKSKETKNHESQVNDLKKRCEEFNKLISESERNFTESVKYLKNHNKRYHTIEYAFGPNLDGVQVLKDSKFNLEQALNIMYSNKIGLAKAYILANSILSQVKDNIFTLQFTLFNYELAMKRERGSENIYINSIKENSNFIYKVRRFLKICDSLIEYNQNSNESEPVVLLRKELSTKVKEVLYPKFPESKKNDNDIYGNKKYIWNWIETGVQPSGLEHVELPSELR